MPLDFRHLRDVIVSHSYHMRGLSNYPSGLKAISLNNIGCFSKKKGGGEGDSKLLPITEAPKQLNSEHLNLTISLQAWKRCC